MTRYQHHQAHDQEQDGERGPELLATVIDRVAAQLSAARHARTDSTVHTGQTDPDHHRGGTDR